MNFKAEIAKILQMQPELKEIELFEIESMIEIPQKTEMGDYAFPCFTLSKKMRKAPNQIAQILFESLKHEKIDFLQEIQTAGGYLNFFANKTFFAKQVLQQVFESGEKYGSSQIGKDKTICIDYSSINIAKPFHIGHLSTTVIGHALQNIYKFLGYKTVAINHIGDWGTQFGKLIVAFKLWGDRETINNGGVREMLKIYIKFHDQASEELENQAREWFKKIETGDSEATELFYWFKELTLKEVSKVYQTLGIEFDSYDGESFYNDKMDEVIEILEEKKLLVKDQGASVVNFPNPKDPENPEMPPCLILKADGASLYATRDLAAAMYRKRTYNFYKSLYVVAYQQNLHFKQVFKVLDLMGFDWAKDCEHVAFGMVSIEEGTLSTRKGNIVFLEDVFTKAKEKALDLILEKSPDLENKNEVAGVVGVGAVVFNALCASRIKDIVFSYNRVLTFEGETGPYCQYTYARCCSLIKKAGDVKSDIAKIDFSKLQDKHAQEVLKNIECFKQSVLNACEKNEPFFVTRNIISLCQAFNKFYFENKVIGENQQILEARLALIQATKTVIKTGLSLIGVSVVEKM